MSAMLLPALVTSIPTATAYALEAIVAGKHSAHEIADEHGITRDMVYSLKHAAKKKHIIQDPAQRLDGLDPISPPRADLMNEVYQLACKFRAHDIDNLDFYQDLKKLFGV